MTRFCENILLNLVTHIQSGPFLYKFQYNFLWILVTPSLIFLKDVLICHASEINGGRDIVWVARKAATKAKDGSQLEALVFECASEGEAKDLAKKFLEIRQRHVDN